MKLSKKIVGHKFGKDVFYLGKRSDGSHIWIEDFTWDCDWYWGGGYLENYQYNAKSLEGLERANDIREHTHIDKYVQGGSINKFQDDFISLVLNKSELYKLSSLFDSFYKLREAAGYFHRKDDEMWKKLNAEIENNIAPKIRELLS